MRPDEDRAHDAQRGLASRADIRSRARISGRMGDYRQDGRKSLATRAESQLGTD